MFKKKLLQLLYDQDQVACELTLQSAGHYLSNHEHASEMIETAQASREIVLVCCNVRQLIKFCSHAFYTKMKYQYKRCSAARSASYL